MKPLILLGAVLLCLSLSDAIASEKFASIVTNGKSPTINTKKSQSKTAAAGLKQSSAQSSLSKSYAKYLLLALLTGFILINILSIVGAVKNKYIFFYNYLDLFIMLTPLGLLLIAKFLKNAEISTYALIYLCCVFIYNIVAAYWFNRPMKCIPLFIAISRLTVLLIVPCILIFRYFFVSAVNKQEGESDFAHGVRQAAARARHSAITAGIVYATLRLVNGKSVSLERKNVNKWPSREDNENSITGHVKTGKDRLSSDVQSVSYKENVDPQIVAELCSSNICPEPFDKTFEAWLFRIGRWGKVTITYEETERKAKYTVSQEAFIKALTDTELRKILGVFTLFKVNLTKCVFEREYDGLVGDRYKELFTVEVKLKEELAKFL